MMISMLRTTIRQHRRRIFFGLLVLAVMFYALGTGFSFFYRLLFTLVALVCIGYGWAWLNLRGLDVRLIRLGTRGSIGEYLEGQIQLVNRTRMPKSWLEVSEDTDLPNPGGRTVSLVKRQLRSFRVSTYLSRRGVYRTGRMRVTARDPFGLFQLSRTFLNHQTYTVLPRTVPLPNLDRRFANLPSDSVFSRRTLAVTPESSSIRDYAHGDGLRRIHWPYTARMNRLMVKEFDIGVSAQAWAVLDMDRRSHVGIAPDNTEELAVTVAASLVRHWDETAIPAGFAANGAESWIFRPDRRPAQLGILMEALAGIHADGSLPLERFLNELRPHLTGFNTLMVITSSRRPEWVSVLVGMRRQGVNVAVCYVDPGEFGATEPGAAPGATAQITADYLAQNDVPLYLVRRDGDINAALSHPLTPRTEQTGEAADIPDRAAPAKVSSA